MAEAPCDSLNAPQFKPIEMSDCRIKCTALNETTCIKCNTVSTLSFYVAALDSLKANLMTWPRHCYLYLIYCFIFFRTCVLSYLPRGSADSVRSSSRLRPCDLHQTAERASRDGRSRFFAAIFIAIFTDGWLAVDSPLDRDPTAMVTPDRDHPPHLKLNPTVEKDHRRTPRSQTDRTKIAARLSRDQGDFVVESSWNRLQLIGR